MVSIYEDLNLYDKAYDFLVEQAKGHSWLLLSVVQNVVRRVRYCSNLLSAVEIRLAKHDLSTDNQIEFKKIKEWLVNYKGFN